MKISLTWPAQPHTRYAQTAFDAQIGKRIKLNVEGLGARMPCTLLSAVVDQETNAVEFTFEIEDPAACVVLSAYVATGAVNNLSIVDDQES